MLHRDEGEEVLPTMISTRIGAGERVYHRQAGGGGWGDPLDRDPQAVADDVRNGKVTPEAAERKHGVVLEAGTGEVDATATEALRRRMPEEG